MTEESYSLWIKAGKLHNVILKSQIHSRIEILDFDQSWLYFFRVDRMAFSKWKVIYWQDIRVKWKNVCVGSMHPSNHLR